MPGKKLGRPTDSPKDIKLQIRVDRQTLNDLDECAITFDTNRSDIVRKGIQRIKADIKK